MTKIVVVFLSGLCIRSFDGQLRDRLEYLGKTYSSADWIDALIASLLV